MPHTRYHSVSHPVTPPLSTQYPMTEVTASISPATGSVSHTQKNAVSVSVSPRHHPGSHQLLSPPSTRAQLPELLPHVKVVSCCCAQSPQPLRVLSRISCCQGPHQAGPSLGYTTQSPRAGQQEPGPLCPPHSGSTYGIFPFSVSWDPCVPELVLAPLKGPLGPAPFPGLCFPGGVLLGSQEEADYIV